MSSKKIPTVKFKGPKPQNNIVLAKVNNGIMGPKISFPHRYTAEIDTGIDVTAPSGFKLCFRLATWLVDKGMMATNAPGCLINGRLKANLLNGGREIVELKDGDQLLIVWLEVDHQFNWEEDK